MVSRTTFICALAATLAIALLNPMALGQIVLTGASRIVTPQVQENATGEPP
ncbi:hypothetical protein B0O80DRAFT_492944 [Mortierella sp. GBAus27b]|nr:hypothetical protein B0O80DRAFT_492944 [Mortierella sp. GBAus27b]